MNNLAKLTMDDSGLFHFHGFIDGAMFSFHFSKYEQASRIARMMGIRSWVDYTPDQEA